MPTPPPIACTLTAAEMPKRLAEMCAIGDSSLLSSEASGSTAALRFRGDDATRERLQTVVEAEASCCAFLNFDLAEDSVSLRLTIRAAEGGEPVVHELVAAFRGENPVAA